MTQPFQHALVAAGAFITVAGGHLVPHLFPGRMPQVAGENVVAMLLGDARQELSFALLEKADDYFHGGARHAECEHGLSGTTERLPESCSANGHAHEHSHHSDSGTALSGRSFDIWTWLNRRIHVQEHRHAEGEDARELLPWLWAACRTSPRNIQAYESSAYVLGRMLGQPREAQALLEEGVRLNPESAALEFSLGELALHALKDPARAERAFAAARNTCRPAAGEAGEEDRLLLGRILFYLGYLAHQRGDRNRAAGYLAEAEEEVPEHVGTRDLRRLLNRQHENERKEP